MSLGTYEGGQIIGGGARPRESIVTTTFSASNATASNVIFTLTGVVQVLRLYGVVTTTIGANHTAGFFQLNDQTATPDITASSGITLSGLAVGTLFFKEGLAATALNLKSAAAGFLEEPAVVGDQSFQPFIIGKKSGAVTTLDYNYATTDTPTTGAARIVALWLPLSGDGNLS